MYILRFLCALLRVVCFAAIGCVCVAQTIDTSGANITRGEEFAVTDLNPQYDQLELESLIKYPRQAARLRFEGDVVLSVLVSTEGHAIRFVVSKSIHPLLDACAIEAVQDLDFVPAFRKGHPIDAWITMPIRFRMRTNPPEPDELIRFNMRQLNYYLSKLRPEPPPSTIQCNVTVLKTGELDKVELKSQPNLDDMILKRILESVRKLVFLPRIVDSAPVDATRTFSIELPIHIQD